MRKLEKYLILLYFAICPIELALHLIIVSTTKYVGILIVIIWGLRVLSNKERIELHYQKHNILFLLWLMYCIVSLCWGNTSLYTYSYITTYLEMGALYFVCIETKWTSDDIRHYLYASLFGSLLMSIFVYFYGDTHFVGRTVVVFFGKSCDPNQLAANIIPGALVAAWICFDNKRTKIIRVLCSLAFAFILITILQTGSRGGFISILMGLIVLVTLGQKKHTAIHILYVFFIGIVVFYLVTQLSTSTRDRLMDFESYSNLYAGKGNRLTIWKDLLDDFDFRWIFGHGPGSTISYFLTIYGQLQGVHNTFLLVLYEVGIIGFCLFIYPFVYLIKYNIDNKNGILLAIVISALICSFFLDALILRYIWNGLILCEMYCVCKSNVEEYYIKPIGKYIKKLSN